jgi:putative DNA primase/helicase
MSDLTKILGGPWRPPESKIPDPPDLQLRRAMLSAGIEPPDQLLLDGKLHRFNSGSKRDKSAWYVVYADGVPAGAFGDWREGIEQPFRADMGREYTAAEQMAMRRRMEDAKALREMERKRQADIASDTVVQIWEQAGAASPEHPYLKRKGIQPHGSRVTGDGRLIVPLYNIAGKLSSLQYIASDGSKKYHASGITAGSMYCIGEPSPGPVYVAEGFATAATIHEATGAAVYVAYSASNLPAVVQAARQSSTDVVIVADNDASGVGRSYADQASAKYGARVVMPPIAGDANDYHLAGHDLAALLKPAPSDWLVPADDWSAQPAPISWLVKHWLQEQALIMIHGPSGGGKTFVLLDMLLRMASGGGEWMGHKTKPANVVYLAGEGHHGLRGRIAAWKHHHRLDGLSMWLSRDGCDLNTPAGYQRVAEAIRALPVKPDVISVDTLHRFLLGDENSAQDAKTMLDACAALMMEFSCSVILVHHTGVSDEAQHRARGSSAWRGALDIEISVQPKQDAITITQRKSKDAELSEPVYVELQSVAIPGWLDEDGEPVTSAVVIEGTPPKGESPDSKLAGFRKMFENAWADAGAEWEGDHPYLSRSAMKEYLIKTGVKESTAEKKMRPGTPDQLIGMLVNANILKVHQHGWIVLCEQTRNALKLKGKR